MTVYYFLVLIFISFYSAISYMVFRCTLYDYFRAMHISKTRIKKLSRGLKNYWWYEKIRSLVPMKFSYSINKIFTICFLFTFSFHLLLGWFKYTAYPVLFFNAVISILTAVINAFSAVLYNRITYKRIFVFFKINQRKTIDCFVFDIFSVIMPFIMFYAHCLVVKALFCHSPVLF